MLMRTLERSPHVWVHHESRRSVAFRDFRLRSERTLERLIAWSPAKWVVFKPVCDAHLTDRLLERFPGARVLWPYRRYEDVANSAVRRWGGHHKDIMRAITRGDWEWLGWRGERLSPETVNLILRLYRDDMGFEEAAALQWYLRNHFYFELGLDRDSRVLLLSYERLVTAPKENFERVLSFLGGCPREGLDLGAISPRSLGKSPFPQIDPEIEQLCERMMHRLEHQSPR